MVKVADVWSKGGGKGKGMLIYEKTQQKAPIAMGDHYFKASRTTETQQKEKSG